MGASFPITLLSSSAWALTISLFPANQKNQRSSGRLSLPSSYGFSCNPSFRTLSDSAASFPPEFASKRVLPPLLQALEFGGTTAAIILPLVLQFGAHAAPEEYTATIVNPIVKLYGSPDRGTRMALLDHLPSYIDKLDKKTVSDKIFPHLVRLNAQPDATPCSQNGSKLASLILSQSFERRRSNPSVYFRQRYGMESILHRRAWVLIPYSSAIAS